MRGPQEKNISCHQYGFYCNFKIDVETSNAAVLEAAQDICFITSEVLIDASELLAGNKILYNQQEVDPGLKTVPQGFKVTNRTLEHSSNGGTAYRGGGCSKIQAGATIELNLEKRPFQLGGTMTAPLMVFRNAGNITLQGQQGGVQQVPFRPRLNLSNLFHKQPSVLYTVDTTGHAESLIIPDLPIGRPIPNLSPVIALTEKGIEVNPDLRQEFPTFTQVDLLQEGLMETIMKSFYYQNMRDPEDIFRWLRGNAYRYILRVQQQNPALLLRQGLSDEMFVERLFRHTLPEDSFLYYGVPDLKHNGEDILQPWLFNHPSHDPGRRLTGSGVINAKNLLMQSEHKALQGPDVLSLPDPQNPGKEILPHHQEGITLPTLKIDNGAINVTGHAVVDGFNVEDHRDCTRTQSGKHIYDSLAGIHVGGVGEFIGHTFKSNSAVNMGHLALHMDEAHLSGTMNVPGAVLWNVRDTLLERAQDIWYQHYETTRERSNWFTSSSNTEVVSILHKASRPLHISGHFHGGKWIVDSQMTEEERALFYTSSLMAQG